ncbi:acyl-CoA dehydrogenase family protein, partial [Rhizobiaceae sp. 2RAB30]
MLRESVQDFCARHPGVARTRMLRETEPGYDPGLWREMAQAGWTGIALPEAVGGLGLGLAEICIVAEELAADLAPEPFAPATLAAVAIAGGDNEALRRRLLPTIISGERVAAFAWQEAANAPDMLGPATRLDAA